jgi:hypothetical protein
MRVAVVAALLHQYLLRFVFPRVKFSLYEPRVMHVTPAAIFATEFVVTLRNPRLWILSINGT